MLTMRPQKAVVFSLVATERAYDIVDDDKPVAVVSYLKNKGGRIAIDGKQYPVVRSGGASDEMLGQALVRMMTGRKRVPASWTLTDADGKTLASAEHSKEAIAVTRGGESFSFRKVKKIGHQLFRAGSDQPVSWTESKGSPSNEFDPVFQAFLFSLVAALTEEDLGGVDAPVINT